MQFIFNIINIPLGFILRFLSDLLFNNFAVAIIVFTVIINVATIPLTLKSQKSSVSQLKIKPKLDEIKKKYGDDKQKYNAEMQKLYQEENISMGGGCLPMIIRMLIMLSVFYLVRSPLQYLMGNDVETLQKAWEALGNTGAIDQIKLFAYGRETLAAKGVTVTDLDFTLFGINLTDRPVFGFNVVEQWQPIWLIPIGAFVVQMLTSVVSMKTQKKLNPDAPSMAGMMLTMPLITLFIGFTVPGAVGFYWLCSGLIGSVVQLAVQNFYGPQKMLAKERAGSIVRVYQEEKKYIEKRVAENNDENA